MGLRDKIYDSLFEKDDESLEPSEDKKSNPTRIEKSIPQDKKLDKEQIPEPEKPKENNPPYKPLPKKSSWFSIREYERTCQHCGTVWHSLKSRETDIKLSALQGTLGSCQGSLQQCQTCGMCGGTRQATGQRNRDANVSELNRLKSCPRCGSHNYSEKELIYDSAGAKEEFNRGVELSKLGQHSEALASFDKAIALNPNNGLAWSNRGVSLRALGRNLEAKLSYEKACKFNPNDPNAWHGRGLAELDLGHAAVAVMWFEKAIALKPDFAMAWNNRGVALARNKKYSEAIASYDRAIAIDPNFELAKKNREIALGNR